jgi:hypothetical protein
MLFLDHLDEKLFSGKQTLLLEGAQLLGMGSVDNEADRDRCHPPYHDANAAVIIAEVFLTPHFPLLLMAVSASEPPAPVGLSQLR